MKRHNGHKASIMGRVTGHNRSILKESEHSIIGKNLSILCTGLMSCMLYVLTSVTAVDRYMYIGDTHVHVHWWYTCTYTVYMYMYNVM